MRLPATMAFATLPAFFAAAVIAQTDERVWTPPQVDEAWQSYTANVEAKLGIFRNIHVYEQTPDRWELRAGRYLPITVDDEVPEEYVPHMKSDRPMMLPTIFEGWTQDQGQSIPYGVVGRMAGSNPEVQWVFLARHYIVKDPATFPNSFTDLRDVAVIGHHPRTGATAFFQYYDPPDPKSAATIVSPWSTRGQSFWNDITWMADIDCGQCHSADPFIHTPWISQATLDVRPGQATPEPVVPSSPFGPFYYIGAEVDGENIMARWDRHLEQLDSADNTCTSCHRISVSDPLGLYANSTHGAGNPDYDVDCAGAEANHGYCFQTDAYRARPWMPPVAMGGSNFYAGQSSDLEAYLAVYGADAAEVIDFAGAAKSDSHRSAPIPAPAGQKRAIMIERDHRDEIAADRSLLVVDTRMRANTDGALDAWRFIAPTGDMGGMTASPVILRRVADGSGGMQFRVQFVGERRNAGDAGDWVPVSSAGDVAIRQGDHLGLLLSNDGVRSGDGLVPYSEDDWAAPVRSGGAAGHTEGVLTYRTNLDRLPRSDDLLEVRNPDYRTYSFEFRNRL